MVWEPITLGSKELPCCCCCWLLEDFTLELDFAEELEDLGCCCCWLLEDFTLELDFGC